MPLVSITDPNDPRLADYRFLRDRDLRRGDEGLFVGEQFLVVEEMLKRPGVVRSVLVDERFLARLAPQVPEDVPLLAGSAELLERIVGFHIHRGVLAVGTRAAVESPSLDDLLERVPPPGDATLLLLEDIANIDNMGLLFRNAAAFGVDGVLLSPRCHDPLYRRVLRVSIGHVLNVPWTRSRDWPNDLRTLRERHGFTLLAAALKPGAAPLDEVERPPRVGLLVGTEFAGVSAAALACCDRPVRIPMAPGVDSLNVGVAAAVCLHRLSRADRV
ncbi:MAG: RNA methyltransferase [Phycisphaerales bacterium]|nr:RNA methyltransferase [Phycisphaerales bacterium]